MIYTHVVKNMRAHGITVQGCFVLGLDEDGPEVFDATIQQVLYLRVDIPRYSIYTPYPGTQLFARMQAEGRMLSYNWDDYDTMHVVARPARLTPEQLYEGFKRAYRETFRMRHVCSRVRGLRLTSLVNFVGNAAYRIFVRRLYSEPRFAQPYTRENPGRAPEAGDWADAFLAAHGEGVA